MVWTNPGYLRTTASGATLTAGDAFLAQTAIWAATAAASATLTASTSGMTRITGPTPGFTYLSTFAVAGTLAANDAGLQRDFPVTTRAGWCTALASTSVVNRTRGATTLGAAASVTTSTLGLAQGTPLGTLPSSATLNASTTHFGPSRVLTTVASSATLWTAGKFRLIIAGHYRGRWHHDNPGRKGRGQMRGKDTGARRR
jgi:hypothetical protein